jgi:RNA polymerase subunit RPABC4/transcription elongation factor Spt4
MKKKECPSCAMEIDSDANVCPICAYEFPETKFPLKWIALILAIIVALFFLVA